jgi:hypothetical protein
VSFTYCVYGLTVDSEIPLALPTDGECSLAAVALRLAEPSYFSREAGTARLDTDWSGWFQYVPLPDGRSWVRGWEMGEFLVSADGREIVCRREPSSAPEAFQVYLLGQALSFSLLKLGFEPLHATAVVVNGGAVALLGESGSGKSTLAACFVGAGHPVLTDDVLMVHETRAGVMAYPGPPRIKLFPKVAGRFVDDLSAAVSMNAQTSKLVVPLGQPHAHDRPVPVDAIYEVVPPQGVPGPQDVRIGSMTGRDAALALVRATFNQRFVNRERLARQFSASTSLAERVPVRTLSYPRLLSRLPEVVAAVVEDVEQVANRRVRKDPPYVPC